MLQVLVCVLDHHHRRIDHRADGNRDAAQRQQVGADALRMHDHEGRQHAQRQGDHRDQRRTQVPQEQRADQGDDEEFLAQLVGQVAHGFTDQPGAVVGRHDLDARRQAGFQILQLGLDRLDRRQRVLA